MKRTVLLVDDDVSVRESLQKVLTQAGYEVVSAGDGEEAVARFDLERIGLLLLDLNLPFKHGWKMFGPMSTALNPATPIIIIAGQPDPNPTVLMAGAGAFMEKPVDVDYLLKTMAELLSASENVQRSNYPVEADEPLQPACSCLCGSHEHAATSLHLHPLGSVTTADENCLFSQS